MDDILIGITLDLQFVANYVILLADETNGGVIIVVSDAFFAISGIHVTSNTIYTTITM